MGECANNADFMYAMCPEHCLPVPFHYTENCQAWQDPQCTDENCQSLSDEGECSENKEYMVPMCLVTCEGLEEPPEEQKLEYVGCYTEDSDHDLGYGPQSKGFSVDSCRKACLQYPYFAVQADGYCSCDYTYGYPEDTYPPVSDGECAFIVDNANDELLVGKTLV
jgi:hypothetical protein